MNYLKSIAKLYIKNQFVGTAWLINTEFVITAAHCVGKHTNNITVTFGFGEAIAVMPIDCDEDLDIALLKLDIPQFESERLEIVKRPSSNVDISHMSEWLAHGYPNAVNDRFNAGLSIGGRVRNIDSQFDYSPAIQLLCEEGVNDIDFDDPYLRGMSGAPVMTKTNQQVIGIIRYAPPEFGERIIVATPIDSATERFQQYLPNDLHIFDKNNQSDDEFDFDFDFDFDGEELCDEQKNPQKLKDFQKDIYNTFDYLGITCFAHYQRLNEQERLEINKEILSKMIALGGSHDDLLELNHVNTRFPKNLLKKNTQKNQQPSWDVLHRKTAIYSDHSLICINSIRHYTDTHFAADDKTIDNKTINLLLQHRSLIELGKMSVVPEVVKLVEKDFSEKTVFNVGALDTTKVDLKDPTIKNFFFKQGRVLQRKGAIVLKSPHSEGLPLEDIMEIISGQYPDMFEYFQTHLKQMMGEINPENDTHALKCGLRKVDNAIQELDQKYESAKRKRRTNIVKTTNCGALAMGIYSTESDVTTFIDAAFADSKLSSLISFIPESEPFPDEIRESPFFIPWLIHHKS